MEGIFIVAQCWKKTPRNNVNNFSDKNNLFMEILTTCFQRFYSV